MAKKIRQIHDKLMKSILSDEEARHNFFNAFLPEPVKEVLDLTKIEHVPGSFLNTNLKATHADMIFKCPLRTKEGTLTILLCIIITEHKSYPDPYATIQLGGYSFDAYRKQVDARQRPLQIVLPFLYYHGTKEWVPPAMSDLFPESPAALKKYVPFFDFIFINIQHYTDEQIRQLGMGLFSSAVLAQKYGQQPEELKKRFEQILSIIDTWEDRNLFDSLTVYIINILQIDLRELHFIVEKIPEKMKTKIMSLGDRLREEGIVIGEKKGREEGRERKNISATKNMLRKEFPVPVICEVLEVSPEFVQKVKKMLREEK